METSSNNYPNKTKGIMLGAAVGDAIGLPMEGMSSKRIKRLKWMEDPYTVRHHFFLGKGMWSDDTEHTIMLTQALLASDGDVVKFRKSLGKYRSYGCNRSNCLYAPARYLTILGKDPVCFK